MRKKRKKLERIIKIKGNFIFKSIKANFIIKYLYSASSQTIDAKNGWALISSASPFPEPSRFTGFLYRSFKKRDTKYRMRTRNKKREKSLRYLIYFTALSRDLASAERKEGNFK